MVRLAASCLLMHTGLVYLTGKMVAGQHQICQVLSCRSAFDHTTLQRTYKKLHMLDFEKMKNQLLNENGSE